MGLFSGSFGTGLAQGLATSVDRSLRDAMDKRDKEMSAARSFWQTRQAQKMDLAEERDRRTNKALDRMIDEMDGDIAKGVAAFKAAGGDVDQVESFITALDETRAAGLKYSVTDKLNLDNVDFSQYEDLTLEAARRGFATEVKPLDIQMEDMSGLANLGLGMKDMGKGISESVNKLIPPREREAITGLTGAVLDRSGLITSERYKQEVTSKIPDMEKQISNNLYQINNGTDVLGRQLTEADIQKLEEDNAKLITQSASLAKSLDPSSGPNVATLSGAYSKGLSELKDEHGYGVDTATKIITVTTPDGTLTGPDAVDYWKKVKNQWKSDWVSKNILDDDGNYRGEGDDAARLLGLDNIASSVRSSIASAPADGTEEADAAAAASSTQPSAEEIAKRLTAKYTTPSSFADAFKEKAKDAESLYNMMVQYYGDVDDATLSQIAIDAIASKPPPRGFVSSGTADTSKPTVMPRPGGLAGMNWDRMYEDTHNDDGTPK